MARYLVVFAVSCVLSGHAAQISKDAHDRIVRSPYYYGLDGPPSPPPPPIGPPPPVFFHTKNWSGLARSADGTAQGVFSGAAAAADSLPTSGAAYSLASSGAVDGSGSCCGKTADLGRQSVSSPGSYGGKSSQYNGQVTNEGTAGYSQLNGGNSGGHQSSKDFKESHFSYQSGENQYGKQGSQGSGGNSGYSSAQSSAIAGNGKGSSNSHDVESFGDQQQLQQTQNLNSASQGYSGGQQIKLDSQFDQYAQGQQQVGFNGQAGAADVANGNGASFGHIRKSGGISGSADQSANGLRALQQSGSNSASKSGYGDSGGSGAESLQSTLGGALNLASQGLQASEQGGCSTCGKNNYALSNAKSHSGSAVAVSIGG